MNLFSDYIKKEIEKRMNNVPYVVKQEDNVKIAKINYLYKNPEILDLLGKRGDKISDGNLFESKSCCSKEKVDPIANANMAIKDNLEKDNTRADKD